MQHIIGMPLQLIIIGIPESIIFIISSQQRLNIIMSIPGIGIILHIIMPSALMLHSMAHCMDGIGMPIPMAGIIIMFIGILAMASCDMHIIDMLPQCIIIGMAQSIIMDIISALFLNIALSMPAAGIMVQFMQSACMSQLMVAIIMGMPIIIGMLAFIGICIAFIMVNSLIGWKGLEAVSLEAILGRSAHQTSCQQRSQNGRVDGENRAICVTVTCPSVGNDASAIIVDAMKWIWTLWIYLSALSK
ncbi:hypothetical protein M2262_002770 [Pseudomonas sp. BIGb0408]|uniref:Uncharacterized protein n=1 Tax=Phytopseudomonas flavescens TaxID=29435 RepID=A0A7Z0BNC6_9GAMM|nr:hypothetical protein [Pseudomonas sp. BIGb0408]NYH72710.1 hypothetical protein [Pseudomonas flavescens]